MDEYITLLPKGNKKQKVLSYYCNLYKNFFVDAELHMRGAKHQRLNEVEDILSKLQASGIGMFTNHVDCDLFLFDSVFFF